MEHSDLTEKIASVDDKLRVMSSYLTKNKIDAEDLYQETIFKIIKNRHLFKKNDNFKGWCATIMRNEFINGYRRSKKINETFQKVFNLNDIASTYHSVESELSAKEISKIINQMDKKFSRSFMMRLEGYKYKEISKSLNIPIGTVKSNIHLTRNILKEKLKDYV